MTNLIITLSWTEPSYGSDARIVFLSSIPAIARVQGDVIESIIAWAEKKAGKDWGATIAHVMVFYTDAVADDLNYQEAVAYIATNIRYDTGEGIYDEDCPWLLEHKIERS